MVARRSNPQETNFCADYGLTPAGRRMIVPVLACLNPAGRNDGRNRAFGRSS